PGLASAQPLHEFSERSELDFGQARRALLASEQIERLLEQVDVLLLRGELHLESERPLRARLLPRQPCALERRFGLRELTRRFGLCRLTRRFGLCHLTRPSACVLPIRRQDDV